MSEVRIAAVGDVHVGTDSSGVLGDHDELLDEADVLLLAGDLTRHGTIEEARVLADELRRLDGFPIVAVLGNHDYESDHDDDISALMTDAGVIMLDGESAIVEVGESRVGVAGTPGFGGGFEGAGAAEFGEPLMKAFVRRTKEMAAALCQSLLDVADTDVRIALTHYSPVEQTLRGERAEIYPFLGSYLLAEGIDRGGADLAVHGHAHRGTRHGRTPCGVPVRNVAQPLIGCAYAVFRFPSRAQLAEMQDA